MINKNILLSLCIFVFLLANVSANFACGKVVGSLDNMSPSWLNVRVYYAENPEDFTTCLVSPEENKYCCDLEAITGHTFEIGEEVVAELIEPSLGYYAGKVSLITTAEGFDIFPEMVLNKIFSFNFLDKSLYLQNSSLYYFSVNLSGPFDLIGLYDGANISLCESCEFFEGKINLRYGKNHLNFYTFYEDIFYSENISLFIVQSLEVSRDVVCDGCSNGEVREGEVVDMKLKVGLSHEVENFEFREFVPVDWEIVETDGSVFPFSSSHNVIVWTVSGKNVEKSYKVRAPEISFWPKRYNFETDLGNYLVNSQELVVYRWFSFLSSDEDFDSESSFTQKQFITQEKPLVIHYSEEYLSKIAVYPRENLIGSYGFEVVSEKEKSPPKGTKECYWLKGNIPEDKISDMKIIYKIGNKNLEDHNYDFYYYDGVWKKANSDFYLEKGGETYYSVNIINPEGFAIVESKKKSEKSIFFFFNTFLTLVV